MSNTERDCGCYWKWLLQYTKDNLIAIKNETMDIFRSVRGEVSQHKWSYKFSNLVNDVKAFWEAITDPFIEILVGFLFLYIFGMMFWLSPDVVPRYIALPLSIFGYLVFSHGQFRRQCKV